MIRQIARDRRVGMTLVELVLAVALSALLLSVMVGVLSGISQQSRAGNRFDQPVWPEEFLKLLRRDLMSAESIWREADVIWMRADANGYQSSGLGVRKIGYRCETLRDNQPILVRLDDHRVQTLALGPARIEIERLDSAGQPQPLPPVPGPVPSSVRVWVWTGQVRALSFSRDLVTR